MMATASDEISRLANYLMETWPDEIGGGDPIRSESAVDVAIRLLNRLKAVEEMIRGLAALFGAT